MKFILFLVLINSFLAVASASGALEQDFLFETERLRAYSASELRIEEMASLLNQKSVEGHLNGKYYEDGLEKTLDWISHMKQQVLEKKFSTCLFFYNKKNLSALSCFVGREPRFKFPTIHRLFYATSLQDQNQGITSEAIKGFFKFFLSDKECEALELSIHPDNASSLKIATNTIGASLSGKASNARGSQAREIYSIVQQDLDAKIQTYPEVTLPAKKSL